ncbi:MAG: hypothetical protein WED04_03090 [Promethearchaeati archaeon SRVP18_Atabeyarchaeia-1]
MESSRHLQQNYLDETFDARGFCSLCGRLVSRSFSKRFVISEEEISRIMDQENIQIEPTPHVHIFWIDRNFCVRRVEGVKVRDEGLKTQTRIVDETLNPHKESNVVLLGDNFISSFNKIGGFLIRNGSTVIESMPRATENSLITKYSSDHDVAVSILPCNSSSISNLSEWVKTFVKAIENSQKDLDSNSIWLALSYGDTNAERVPVAVDEKIISLLLSSRHLAATLRPEIKSLILSFSDELGVELDSVEQSFNLKNLYDEVEDMIKRVGVGKTSKLFFKLFNNRMLKIERLA